jgi:hypothetical protein
MTQHKRKAVGQELFELAGFEFRLRTWQPREDLHDDRYHCRLPYMTLVMFPFESTNEALAYVEAGRAKAWHDMPSQRHRSSESP